MGKEREKLETAYDRAMEAVDTAYDRMNKKSKELDVIADALANGQLAEDDADDYGRDYVKVMEEFTQSTRKHVAALETLKVASQQYQDFCDKKARMNKAEKGLHAVKQKFRRVFGKL